MQQIRVGKRYKIFFTSSNIFSQVSTFEPLIKFCITSKENLHLKKKEEKETKKEERKEKKRREGMSNTNKKELEKEKNREQEK